ncbi:hypothetical protein GLOTRDRAFT_116829 [Gloeophyllum trabeum ATCC 11539]|uniref:MARVEL domain-containing protein n=1 Tax=Gloeophyllum trabeum (strain ATCC 11539 / FP-39264 / Madison 617) TaxID=670483 RepID=S7Q469_GLOTA|nr:uncharacterized protein GLOTRDRAFT_116829 [Gloeophyllum trabeum ATCC 11539]EPQ54263.1 hypothetical protein GLOTRDRAFT_116829 [Gloeophyllum trabeum ATCC 11539]
MTILFANRRTTGFVTVLILSAVVLGISAYFGHEFLPNHAADITIFSLVVSSLTILVLIVLLVWSQPRIEAFWLFVLAVLWLAMGAWYDDLQGHTDCSALTDALRTTTNTGTISSRAYCYETKVVEAFSWMTFILLAVYLIILIALTGRSQVLGRPYAWQEPIIELPWFGEYPGYPGPYQYSDGYAQNGQMMPGYGQPTYVYPGMMGGGQMPYVIRQNPGESIVIQPGMNGGAPFVQQVQA